jgi:excisionase family DNA binding protein
MAERFLSSQQASQLLGVNADTMRRYLREGKVRALRLGKDWKIPESALSDLARGGRLAKGGKPIASAPASTPAAPNAQDQAAKMQAFLKLADELRPVIEAGTRDVQNFSGADLIRQSHEERDHDISGEGARD